MAKKCLVKPYDRLLSGVRRRPTTVLKRTLEEESESDRGRVLFSAPWRRLQNKAQVFSLETNASVRSRLTHSLEVATVGRQVAQAAYKVLSEKDIKNSLGLIGKERAFINFVENACIIHDLGNPPFGHFGEDAISDWFEIHKNEIIKDIAGDAAKLWAKHCLDFTNFDGNPQGFRIVTRLQIPQTDDLNGLNLTATTLAATLKYPIDTTPTKDTAATPKKIKKSHFHTEDDVVEWIHKTLGMDPKTRHPLVTLMEAADDIAYCISDIEDSIEKGVVSQREFVEHVKSGLKDLSNSPFFSEMIPDFIIVLDKFDENHIPQRFNPLFDLRTFASRSLSKYVGARFAEVHSEILDGCKEPLIQEDGPNALLNIFKDFARSKIYKSKIVLQREISAHSVLSGLLDINIKLMNCDYDRFKKALDGEAVDSMGRRVTVERSLVSQLPKKHIEAYRAFVEMARKSHKMDTGNFKAIERVYRIRLILDWITGMTDSYALRSYHLMSGVEV